MHYHNPEAIKDYIRRFAGHHRHLYPLLEAALFQNIQKDFRFTTPVTDESVINNYSSRKAFRKANRFKNGVKHPITIKDCLAHITDIDGEHLYNDAPRAIWLRFRPNKELDALTQKTLYWLSRFINHVGQEDYSGFVPITACAVLKRIDSLHDIETMVTQGTFPLNDEDIEQAKAIRVKSYEEERGLAKCLGALSGRCYLLQITTIRGMKLAGKKAENCLGWRSLPDGSDPHKIRVLRPDRWLYFSIRNADNESVATLFADVRMGKIGFEGNAHQPVPESRHHLLDEAVEIIHREFPQIRINAKQHRPHNATPRFGD